MCIVVKQNNLWSNLTVLFIGCKSSIVLIDVHWSSWNIAIFSILSPGWLGCFTGLWGVSLDIDVNDFRAIIWLSLFLRTCWIYWGCIFHLQTSDYKTLLPKNEKVRWKYLRLLLTGTCKEDQMLELCLKWRHGRKVVAFEQKKEN